MKSSLILVAIIGSVVAAPAKDITENNVQRTKKSALDAPWTAMAPPSKGEHNKEEAKEAARSYSASIAAPSYSGGYGGGYGLGPASILGAGSLAGPAVGVFPNARIGGCSVPLLLSCSPSVITGHLAASHSYDVPAYKNVDDKEGLESFLGSSLPLARITEFSGRAASHHKVLEDYPEHAQSKHLISQDLNLAKGTIGNPENDIVKEHLEEKL